ncbi:MAG: DUF3298/DUF4163 domain-containing protein [Firmicutes bacterium HGW-Firmicutes-16]|nr:MAG: DUF3298/DUF4163 domain-containing protein [Firmicutes bacterium HGW-Firmicutes-16]
MAQKHVTCKKCVLKDSLMYDGVTLVTYAIEYPRFCSSCYKACLMKVNEYYKNRALEYRRYCETELFGMAIEQYKGDIENNFPVRVFEALSTFKVTYLCSCIISLYTDEYEFTGGAHGNTVRDSQTWNLQDCCLLALWQLVCCPPDYRSYILAAVEEQIRCEPEIYFENYKELICDTFNEDSFYCTPKRLVVYYQQYDIAPYSSGIREFLLPYSCCVI